MLQLLCMLKALTSVLHRCAGPFLTRHIQSQKDCQVANAATLSIDNLADSLSDDDDDDDDDMMMMMNSWGNQQYVIKSACDEAAACCAQCAAL